MKFTNTEELLSQIIEAMNYPCTIVCYLQSKGYKLNFELVGNKLMCIQTKKYYWPRELQVDEIYQFEKENTSTKQFYLYALRSRDSVVMGLFTAYPASGL